MKKVTVLVISGFLGAHFILAQPPKAPSVPVTDTIFGKAVTDPFRNLEKLDDTAVMNWYKSQANHTANELKKLPMRDRLFEEMKDLDAKFKYTVSVSPTMRLDRAKDHVFYVKAFAGEQTGKLYYQEPGTKKEILLFDPNKDNKSGVLNIISGYSASYDASKVAVVIIQKGNEVGNLLIIDRKLGKVVERAERVWEPAQWIDNQFYTYSQFPSADVHSSSFLSNMVSKKHKVGDNFSEDPIILSHKQNRNLVPDSANFPFVYTPHENAKFIIGHVGAVEKFNDVYISAFDAKGTSELKWYPFITKQDQITRYILQGDNVFGLSVKENKKGKILLTSALKPDWNNAIVIAEPRKGHIGSFIPFTVTKDYLYYVEVYGIEQNLYRVRLKGPHKPELIKTPVTGTVIALADSPLDPKLRIFVTSWIRPVVIYEYDAAGNRVTKSAFQLSPELEFAGIEVAEVYVTSHDGTKVPLSIIKPKGLKKDGNNPAILYGYGNYGASLNPFFDPNNIVSIRNGIVYAVAHVRGGGEFGEEWRLGGFKSTKQNTWKDAIACAEYLITEGYTQPSKLAIQGASAGGILCGRALTERPDLFAVAIPQVGCLNTLRFEFTPNGPNHIAEFGTIRNEDDFKNLYMMDSYAHIKDGISYPATLVTGGRNDPRVILWQPGKFAARLQQASASGKPVWFRIDMEGGHGFIGTKDQSFLEAADILSFVLWQTNSVQKNKDLKAF